MSSGFSYPEIEPQLQAELLQRIDKEARSMKVVEIIPATATTKRRVMTYVVPRTEEWTPVIQKWLGVDKWYRTKIDGQFSASHLRHDVCVSILDAQGETILFLVDAPEYAIGYQWSDEYDSPEKYMRKDVLSLIKGILQN